MTRYVYAGPRAAKTRDWYLFVAASIIGVICCLAAVAILVLGLL